MFHVEPSNMGRRNLKGWAHVPRGTHPQFGRLVNRPASGYSSRPMAKQNVETIVRGILIKSNHLLVCQDRKSGHCFLPGGHIEFGERAPEALQREVQEEMGVDLAVGKFIGSTEGRFTQSHPKKGDVRHHEINLIFNLIDDTNTLDPNSPPPTIEDHILFDWLSLRDILKKDSRLLPASTGPLVAEWAASISSDVSPILWASDWE